MDTLKGVFTSLITPFDQENHLDEKGLRFLIQRQLQHSIHGIVVLGTTGESPTLSELESERIITIAREEINAECHLMIGTGSYATDKTIKNTLKAKQLGADSALIIVPFYNRPTQEGIYQHFKAITEATDIPIVIYNHPLRTGQNLQLDTLKRLMKVPLIVGIKETSGNISQINDFIELARKERPNFSILSGDDGLTLPLMALGGHGVISVCSNIFPEEFKALIDSMLEGNYETARELHYQLSPIIKALFIESNPIPVKAALNFLNLPAGNCRLPLCDLLPENKSKLESLLQLFCLNPETVVSRFRFLRNS